MKQVIPGKRLGLGWNSWYSLRSYVRSALWVVPILALIAEILAKRLVEGLDDWMVSQGFYDLKTAFFAVNAAEAHAILDRTYNLILSCLVFTFGSMLVAIQVAGGQYTPRIIATTLLRDNVIRLIVGLFVFTLAWVYRSMTEIGEMDQVPQLQVFLGALLGVASLVAFIILIDYSAKLLRPVSLVQRVAERGLAVIRDVYPDPTRNLPAAAGRTGRGQSRSVRSHRGFGALPSAADHGSPDRVILHQGRSAVVLAVNLDGLVAAAQRADCVIEVAVQVGDFLAVDDPLFLVYGSAEGLAEPGLRELIALGSERTMEQDPMFAFRIEVDIALKALSAAINDPTTAVLAIDQLQRLLRLVGQRSLHNQEILDPMGQPRVVFRTPDWEDFVHIAFREIRCYGAGSLQIQRRLRAMIASLIRALPEYRHAALHQELDLLDRALAEPFRFAEDIALARIPDTQGLGGAQGARDTRFE